MKTSKIFGLMVLVLFVLSTFAFGQQQWNGAQDAAGDIFRTGKVGIGTPSQPTTLEVNGYIYIGTDNSTGNGLIAHGIDGGFIQAKFGTNFGIRLKATGVNTGAWQWHNGSNWIDGITLNNGNVGIGTTSPSSPLHVRKGGDGDLFTVDDILTGFGFKINLASTPPRKINFAMNPDGSGYRNVLTLDWVGNVGIGTTNPGQKLHVLAQDAVGLLESTTNTAYLRIQTKEGTDNLVEILNRPGGNLALSAGRNDRVIITKDGSVGIGTTKPQNRLDVNGTMRAKEVLVTLENWPDSVFHNDYDLMSLYELEKFIKMNHRLPSIPSEVEVQSQSVNVGEMQAKLLQKIEELTLHMIALKKENDKLNRQVAELREKLE